MHEADHAEPVNWLRRMCPTAIAIWCGEVPLPRMMFLYYFTGIVGLSIPINGIRIFGFQPEGPLWVTYSIGLLVYTCFVSVGTWKSADHYDGSATFLIRFMTKGTILAVYLIMCIGFLVGLMRGLGKF